MLEINNIYNLDCREGLKLLEDNSIDCCITSPPYWGLRDYGSPGQIGLEDSIDGYLEVMVEVFREVKRVLKSKGTLWLNLGDCYAGSGKGVWENPKNVKENYIPKSKHNGKSGLKPKDLIGIPWRVAFALQDDGWYLRSDIIWNKSNAMPESVTDRPTKSHEYMFLFSKESQYYYDHEAIKEPSITKKSDKPRGSKGVLGKENEGRRLETNKPKPKETRNKRSVWTVPTAQFREAHFATFPPKLIEPCILAGCPVGGIVLDPFMGSGTTAEVAIENQRNYIGFELNQDYINIADKYRLNTVQLRIV